MYKLIESLKIESVSEEARAEIDAQMARKTKPPGSLGKLESLVSFLGAAQHAVKPQLSNPTALVVAGDHGLAFECPEVSAFPASVTAQMVRTFLSGGAAISVLARTFGVGLQVVDAGVNADFPEMDTLLSVKQARMTGDLRKEPAMTPEVCEELLRAGIRSAGTLSRNNCNLLILGEMGIGNTSVAALLMHLLTKIPLSLCVGAGTGLQQSGVNQKLEILQGALHRVPVDDPFEALRQYGGFEIVFLAGAMLGAATERIPFVVDGFICSVAYAYAERLNQKVRGYALFSHCSKEKGHRALLDFLEVEPLLDLDLRLGEASGAILTVPLLRASVALLEQMATFDSADVEKAFL